MSRHTKSATSISSLHLRLPLSRVRERGPGDEGPPGAQGRFGVLLVLTAALLMAQPALAGRSCEPREPSAQEVQRGFETGLHLYERLSRLSGPWGPSPEVVLIGRVGSDLSKHGLRYSHMGFAVRDHAQGPYTVLHLLNHCARSTSDLYVQGLVNFFLDDPFAYDTLIVVPAPELQARLAERLLSDQPKRLHDPRYNMLGHVRSPHSQNSNQWVLELVASALDGLPTSQDRRAVQAAPSLDHFTGDLIPISRLKRLGGIFQANVDFFDQPLKNRLRSRYEVVTVRAVARWLEDLNAVAYQEVLEPPFAPRSAAPR